jgi:hypothetical protein
LLSINSLISTFWEKTGHFDTFQLFQLFQLAQACTSKKKFLAGLLMARGTLLITVYEMLLVNHGPLANQ